MISGSSIRFFHGVAAAVEAHSVYKHFGGESVGLYFAHPAASELHVNQQIVGGGEGELSFELGVNAGIGEGVDVVDEEAERVGLHLDGVGVVAVGVDGSG